jgi:hypothetical protein
MFAGYKEQVKVDRESTMISVLLIELPRISSEWCLRSNHFVFKRGDGFVLHRHAMVWLSCPFFW